MKDLPLIPRDVLYGNPDRASAKLSPDGRHLSWLAPVDGVLNVWVAPADNPDAAEPVTQDTHRGIRAYGWTFRTDKLIYVQDRDGDENWHVYLTDVASGETVDLTDIENVHAQIVGLSHRKPDTLIVGLNDRDPQYHDLHTIDLETGRRALMLENPGFAGFDLDNDLALRFAHRQNGNGDTEILKRAGDEWEPFLTIALADSMGFGILGFDKANESMFVLDARGRDTAALFKMDPDTADKELLAQTDKADIGGTLRHPTELHVQAANYDYLRRERIILDDAIRDDLAYLQTVCEGDVSIRSRTLADTQWLVGYTRDDAPPRTYRYDRTERRAEFLYTARKDMEGQLLVPMHPVEIASRDGLTLVSYLTLPPGTAPEGGLETEEPLPMVLDVHGGPWARDRWGLNATHQWLANRGYAVLSVNYRGSVGFGKSFVNAGNLEWAGTMHDDLIDAVNWAVDRGIADPDRVAIFGGSYGGYAALVGLTFTPEVFACGVDLVGPSNLLTLLDTIPPYWAPMIEQFTRRVGDHRTKEGRELLWDRSPLRLAERIRRPLLIGQGANDPRVKQAESDQIVEAMKAKDIPVTYVLYPDEGHGMARPENRLSFFAVTEAFLAEQLGGRLEPVGDDFDNSSIQILEGRTHVKGLPEDAQ